MKIKVKTSTMVKPMTEKPITALWISKLDAVMPPDFHLSTLYFYRFSGANDFFDPDVLKEALCRALVEFYPVAGRLKKDNDLTQINCDGEGALFVVADSDGTLDNLDDFAPRSELNLVPTVDYSQGISTYPLLLLQVTRFKCGGVCLGIAIQHQLADGVSCIHFINTWSDIAQGRGVTIPPFFDRRVLSARSPPQPHFAHAEYCPSPKLINPPDNSGTSETLVFSIFKLTRDQLNTLKARCQEDDGKGVTYSTHRVLAGHAWRCVSKARGLPEDQATKLCITVDGRARLRPPLPPGYFGNVVFKATCIATCGELESNPLKFAARKIHEALARMDDEYLRSAVDHLELQSDISGGPDLYKCPNLAMVSWARLPLYDADFGWGTPVYIGVGAAPTEGVAIVLPSPTNDGSLLYAISMPKEQMQVFEMLFYDI